MLRPSRPMIRPFMSSEGSSTMETVVSAAWLAATRWSASATRLRAFRRLASVGRLLVELAHAACELVPDELLRAFEHLGFRILHAQAGRCAQLALLDLPSQLSAPPEARGRASRGRRAPGRAARAPRAVARELVLREPHVAARARAISDRRSSRSRSVSLRTLAASSLAASSDSRRNASASRLASSRSRLRVRRAAASFESVRKLTNAQAPRAPATRPMRIPTTYGTGPPIVRPVGSDWDRLDTEPARANAANRGSGADAAQEGSCSGRCRMLLSSRCRRLRSHWCLGGDVPILGGSSTQKG